MPLTHNWYLASLRMVHPVIKGLFAKVIPNILLAEKQSQYLIQWENITRDPDILPIVKEY